MPDATAAPIASSPDAYGAVARFVARSYDTGLPIADAEVARLAAALRWVAPLQDSQCVALAVERLLACGRPVDLDIPDEREIAFRYAVALLRLGEPAAAKSVLWGMHSHPSAYPSATRMLAFVHKDEDPAVSLACLRSLGDQALASMAGLAALHGECLIAAGRTAEARALRESEPRPPLTANLALLDVNLALSSAARLDALNALMDLQGVRRVALAGAAFELDALGALPTRPVEGPPVTVIMTAYQSAPYVARALASIVDQDYRDLDIVVVDDFSQDGTAAAVAGVGLKGRRLTLLEQPCNMGTYAARNRGLEAARGAYVTFHDSDDWAHPERVSLGVAACRAAGAVAATSQWARMDDAGAFLLKDPGGYIHRNHSSLVFDRFAVLSRIGGYQEVRASADSEFLQRIETAFGAEAVRRDGRMLAIGRLRGDSLTRGGETKFSEFGASAVRSIYAGRWIDAHVRATRLAAAGRDDGGLWAAVAAADVGAGLAGLAPQAGGADRVPTVEHIMALDPFARIDDVLPDAATRMRFRAERAARAGAPVPEQARSDSRPVIGER